MEKTLGGLFLVSMIGEEETRFKPKSTKLNPSDRVIYVRQLGIAYQGRTRHEAFWIWGMLSVEYTAGVVIYWSFVSITVVSMGWVQMDSDKAGLLHIVTLGLLH